MSIFSCHMRAGSANQVIASNLAPNMRVAEPGVVSTRHCNWKKNRNWNMYCKLYTYRRRTHWLNILPWHQSIHSNKIWISFFIKTKERCIGNTTDMEYICQSAWLQTQYSKQAVAIAFIAVWSTWINNLAREATEIPPQYITVMDGVMWESVCIAQVIRNHLVYPYQILAVMQWIFAFRNTTMYVFLCLINVILWVLETNHATRYYI